LNPNTQHIYELGKEREVPVIYIEHLPIVVVGGILSTAQIFDEDWQEQVLVEPAKFIEPLKAGRHADLFTFAQRVPEIAPKYPYYFEMDNVAVATIDSYDSWFEKEIDRNGRRNIKRAAKEGIVTKIVDFDDELVEGIQSIYDELRVRQGRKFWHYGKTRDQVKRENGSYLDRSVFIGAYFNGVLVGFLKFVIAGQVATIMQILSKAAHFSRRPTNALLAMAVATCEARGVRYLIYGKHTYGKKDESTLIEFKEKNGFKKIEFPRYYVPLTSKGRTALKLRVHNGLGRWLPRRARAALVDIRNRYYGSVAGRLRGDGIE